MTTKTFRSNKDPQQIDRVISLVEYISRLGHEISHVEIEKFYRKQDFFETGIVDNDIEYAFRSHILTKTGFKKHNTLEQMHYNVHPSFHSFMRRC